mmetsp:Transcript_13432/g.35226  ORF Transcript_13432/g.35226 Transcript_13432/m.35226 type:complete len:113 (-) Transcript_13432:1635-1973(-)
MKCECNVRENSVEVVSGEGKGGREDHMTTCLPQAFEMEQIQKKQNKNIQQYSSQCRRAGNHLRTGVTGKALPIESRGRGRSSSLSSTSRRLKGPCFSTSMRRSLTCASSLTV